MDLHDNALQYNLCLKEQELEHLLFNKEVLAPRAIHSRPPPHPMDYPKHGPIDPEINFLNFKYQVFKEPELNRHRPVRQPPMKINSSNKLHGYTLKDQHSTSLNPFPLPDEQNISFKKLLGWKSTGPQKVPTRYEKLIKKLDDVKFFLKESSKQREHLLKTIQGVDYQGCEFTRMERNELKKPNCCENTATEDFPLIIEKATEIVQTATMETNLYRGMILLVGNNWPTFDAYSSLTARMMMKELEGCIDDVMVILNEFVRDHRFLERFEDFQKHNELLATIDTLITCIRCCTSYTWAMETRYGMTSGGGGRKKQQPQKTQEKQHRDINIGSI